MRYASPQLVGHELRDTSAFWRPAAIVVIRVKARDVRLKFFDVIAWLSEESVMTVARRRCDRRLGKSLDGINSDCADD
jgi:hypothetical protein